MERLLFAEKLLAQIVNRTQRTAWGGSAAQAGPLESMWVEWEGAVLVGQSQSCRAAGLQQNLGRLWS